MPLLAGVIQAASATGDVVINIAGTHQNLNLRDLYDLSNPTPQMGDSITFIFEASATLRSPAAGSPSVRTGVWPVGVVPLLDATAVVSSWKGAGGKGGNGGSNQTGNDGGTAFLAEAPCDFDGVGSTLSGGGGGGGGTSNWPGLPPNDGVNYRAPGGGGAGDDPGDPGAGLNPGGNVALPGTTTSGGSGANFGSDPNQPPAAGGGGGDGGDLGSSGSNAGDGNSGGAAGFSIEGFSLVNFISMPTLVGPTVG